MRRSHKVPMRKLAMIPSLLVSGVAEFWLAGRRLKMCLEYVTGDQFCDICSISLASRESEVTGNEGIPGPGEYVVSWRRSVPYNYPVTI